MLKNCLWTKLKARLQLTRTIEGENFNWLFLAGGPGLGSESLNPLIDMLSLPGAVWKLDLPGDGSNLTDNNTLAFSNWSEALAEAVGALENVILVAHSTGGMYSLATPKLEKLLTGLVLMGSAPDASWQQHFMEFVKQHPMLELEKLHKKYAENPSNELLKQLTILSAPYLFTQAGLKKDISFLETLPYNFEICEWSATNFDAIYKAKWIPRSIPTLIFAGEEDAITPLHLFMESADFKRPSILIQAIKNAGHFPWIENPKEVRTLFEQYYQKLVNNRKEAQ